LSIFQYVNPNPNPEIFCYYNKYHLSVFQYG
jgi:hypothetical protein